MFIVYFLGLRNIEVWPVLFYILPAIQAVKMTLFNYSFHLNFVCHSDQKNRGKEVTMAQAVALAASFIAPFIGGAIIAATNFPTLFIVGSIILVASTIPLFLTQEEYEKISFSKKNIYLDIFTRDKLPYVLSFSGYAIESWIGFILWPIFLYMIFSNTESVGIITSLSTILTFLIFYYVGKIYDTKNKEGVLRLGTILYFFGWFGRIFVNGFASILFIDTYKNLAMHVLHIPWSAYFYDLAAKENYFRFIIQREVTFHVTRMIVLPILMFLFSANSLPFTTAFAIAAVASLFYATLDKKVWQAISEK